MGTFPPRVYPKKATRSSAIRLLNLLTCLTLSVSLLNSCNSDSESRQTPPPQSNQLKQPQEAIHEAPLMCPPAGSTPLQRSAPQTGDHTVILSWRAGRPAAHPEDEAIGYCLYRTTKKDAAKKNPICRDCEQVNSVPIVETHCIDDLVQNGIIYYYVVAAVGPRRQLSVSSNQTVAQIPKSPKKIGPALSVSYPSCRGNAGSPSGPDGENH
jgi:hypothetical protein